MKMKTKIFLSVCIVLFIVLLIVFFCKKKDEPQARLEVFLKEIGADRMEHGNGTLHEHLMGTFLLLRDMKAEDDICLAGGLHSVYGTSAYKTKTIDTKSTIVRDMFGENVDRYVRIFSTMNRRLLLSENDESVGLQMEDLMAMRQIEIANMMEQMPSSKKIEVLKQRLAAMTTTLQK